MSTSTQTTGASGCPQVASETDQSLQGGEMSSEIPAGGLALGYARVHPRAERRSTTRCLDGCRLRPSLRRPGFRQTCEPTRPGLHVGQLRAGDTVVVWRPDRLGRSLRNLIEIFAELDNRGVVVRSLTESIDTSTPGGRLIFHLFGSLAEFERDLIRERTMAGLAAARARGRRGGRPTVWTAEKLKPPCRCTDPMARTSPPSPGCSV